MGKLSDRAELDMTVMLYKNREKHRYIIGDTTVIWTTKLWEDVKKTISKTKRNVWILRGLTVLTVLWAIALATMPLWVR